jgi:hypothetical protein
MALSLNLRNGVAKAPNHVPDRAALSGVGRGGIFVRRLAIQLVPVGANRNEKDIHAQAVR